MHRLGRLIHYSIVDDGKSNLERVEEILPHLYTRVVTFSTYYLDYYLREKGTACLLRCCRQHSSPALLPLPIRASVYGAMVHETVKSVEPVLRGIPKRHSEVAPRSLFFPASPTHLSPSRGGGAVHTSAHYLTLSLSLLT